MRGILLAGGEGTRLSPLTVHMSKQLLPVYDKPMIYYPLSVLMLAGIKDVLIVSTERDIPSYKSLLGDGSQWGITLEYVVQPSPDGLAQAFILGEGFIGKENVCLILGDNIFYGDGLFNKLRDAANLKVGAEIFAIQVQDPERYGVVEFGNGNQVISIEEKPQLPKSNYAVTGLYFYDNQVIDLAKSLKPSSRGELEITDLNRLYLEKNRLKVNLLGRGTSWLDTGTHASLLEASNFISIIQNRQNIQIGSLDEISWRLGLISNDGLLENASQYKKTHYGTYLFGLVEE